MPQQDMAKAWPMKQTHPTSPVAGGAAIALGAIGGVIIGSSQGQPSLGLLAGTGLGIAIAIAVWLRDKARR